MILVFGKSGQVAMELARLAPDAAFSGRSDFDLCQPGIDGERLYDHVLERVPAAVINAAAYTAVDRAEDEEEAATLLNGLVPRAMAEACATLRIPFVHLSTDYVFDGAGDQPFSPDHPTAPLGAYGRSKRLGEQGVAAAGGPHVILRTSWVFSAHGNNFVKTMLRLGGDRDKLTVVADQIGGPTPARDIAAACLTMLDGLRDDPTRAGLYHFAGAPDTSWAGFAREIMAQAGLDCVVEDIPTSGYPTPAHRPLNSRMDCTTLDRFGLARPDWREGLTDVLAELGAKS